MLNAPRTIRTPAELAAYRATEMAPARVRAYVRDARGPVLFAQDAGVGKSQLLDGIVEKHRHDPEAGLLLYATSQTSVVLERPWVREHLKLGPAARAANDIAILIGRPRKQCGDLDTAWETYERAGCSALGRAEICGRCPRRARCSWPEQRTREALAGKRVIAATQANLAATPGLAAELKAKTGASRVEIILDEATVLEARFRRHISYETLRASRAVFARVSAPEPWLEAHDALLNPSYDVVGIASPSPLASDIALAVQREGLASGDPAFRNLAYELPAVPYSSPVRTRVGVEYLARPWLRGHSCLIAAAGLPLELARHRLASNAIEEYSPGVRVLHEGTEVFNICNAIGTARHFLAHRAQILDAFAQLIARLAREGKRALVVTRKRFADVCAFELRARLRELTGAPFRVLRNPTDRQLGQPNVVPLITYGARGINRYETFDAALAICGYHVSEHVIEEQLNDVYGPSDQVRVAFIREGRHRVAIATDYGAQLRGFSALARAYQHQHEAAIAEQALGRVRFAVKPRLVVFFQLGPLRFPLVREFTTLEAFRQHFGLVTRRARTRDAMHAKIAALTAQGAPVPTIAATLRLSERQVFRVRAALRRGAS